MKGYGRIVLNGLTILSALFCAAAVLLWVRSYWPSKNVLVTYRGDQCSLRFTDGILWFDNGPQERIERLAIARTEVAQLRERHAVDTKLFELEKFSLEMLQTGEAINQRWYSSEKARLNADMQRLDAALQRTPLTKRWSVRAAWAAPLTVALLATLPAIRVRRMKLRRLRTRLGLCIRCGYDLRASPGRCPECGKPR